jgi:exopolyphosphatase/pppGpp-phosphohydrolase
MEMETLKQKKLSGAVRRTVPGSLTGYRFASARHAVDEEKSKVTKIKGRTIFLGYGGAITQTQRIHRTKPIRWLSQTVGKFHNWLWTQAWGRRG